MNSAASMNSSGWHCRLGLFSCLLCLLLRVKVVATLNLQQIRLAAKVVKSDRIGAAPSLAAASRTRLPDVSGAAPMPAELAH